MLSTILLCWPIVSCFFENTKQRTDCDLFFVGGKTVAGVIGLNFHSVWYVGVYHFQGWTDITFLCPEAR